MGCRGRSQVRVAVLAAAAALALAASSCGDDGDGGGSDQEQVRATIDRLYEAMAAYDAERACAELNDAAQRQLAAGGLGTKGGTCAESYQAFFDKAKKAGGFNLVLKAKVERVEVDGDSAVATVSFGSESRSGEIPLEKVDGEWKLQAVGGAPSQ